jgi:hypothetical protein
LAVQISLKRESGKVAEMSFRTLSKRVERLEPVPQKEEEPLVHRIRFVDGDGNCDEELIFTFPREPPPPRFKQRRPWRR